MQKNKKADILGNWRRRNFYLSWKI